MCFIQKKNFSACFHITYSVEPCLDTSIKLEIFFICQVTKCFSFPEKCKLISGPKISSDTNLKSSRIFWDNL